MLAEAGLNGNTVRLFHISTDSTVTEHDRIRRNNDGSVTISISSASRYVLSESTPQTTGGGGAETERPPHNVPQTGVNRNLVLPTLLLIFGFVCILSAEVYRRRIKKITK
jgi:hypothetical protein